MVVIEDEDEDEDDEYFDSNGGKKGKRKVHVL